MRLYGVMNKSYSRDYQVLLKMIANVESARDVVRSHNVNFSQNSSYYMANNKDALDLCSFYMAQFGEKVKLLTDETKSVLNQVVNLNIMQYFRNVIEIC